MPKYSIDDNMSLDPFKWGQILALESFQVQKAIQKILEKKPFPIDKQQGDMNAKILHRYLSLKNNITDLDNEIQKSTKQYHQYSEEVSRCDAHIKKLKKIESLKKTLETLEQKKTENYEALEDKKRALLQLNQDPQPALERSILIKKLNALNQTLRSIEKITEKNYSLSEMISEACVLVQPEREIEEWNKEEEDLISLIDDQKNKNDLLKYLILTEETDIRAQEKILVEAYQRELSLIDSDLEKEGMAYEKTCSQITTNAANEIQTLNDSFHENLNNFRQAEKIKFVEDLKKLKEIQSADALAKEQLLLEEQDQRLKIQEAKELKVLIESQKLIKESELKELFEAEENFWETKEQANLQKDQLLKTFNSDMKQINRELNNKISAMILWKTLNPESTSFQKTSAEEKQGMFEQGTAKVIDWERMLIQGKKVQLLRERALQESGETMRALIAQYNQNTSDRERIEVEANGTEPWVDNGLGHFITQVTRELKNQLTYLNAELTFFQEGEGNFEAEDKARIQNASLKNEQLIALSKAIGAFENQGKTLDCQIDELSRTLAQKERLWCQEPELLLDLKQHETQREDKVNEKELINESLTVLKNKKNRIENQLALIVGFMGLADNNNKKQLKIIETLYHFFSLEELCPIFEQSLSPESFVKTVCEDTDLAIFLKNAHAFWQHYQEKKTDCLNNPKYNNEKKIRIGSVDDDQVIWEAFKRTMVELIILRSSSFELRELEERKEMEESNVKGLRVEEYLEEHQFSLSNPNNSIHDGETQVVQKESIYARLFTALESLQKSELVMEKRNISVLGVKGPAFFTEKITSTETSSRLETLQKDLAKLKNSQGLDHQKRLKFA